MKHINRIAKLLKDESDEKIFLNLLKSIKSIEYGYIQIIIQNSQIVQIDKTEKIRLNK